MADTALELEAQRVRKLEAEAIAMHELAQRLNKEGRFEEAQAAYASMHRLEDEASELAARVGCVACVLGEPSQDQDQPSLCTLDPAVLVPYEQLIAVPPWRSLSSPGSEALEARALGCVVGSALADAAAMGVHWVYDMTVLDDLEQDRRQQQLTATAITLDVSQSVSPPSSSSAISASCLPSHPFTFGLEFMDPPRSPFYSYTSGRNSPYGEQTLVLLRSLAESAGGGGSEDGSPRGSAVAGPVGLHCGQYAALFAQTFGPGSGFDGYRDVSTKGFLRNYSRGLPPPLSGANDAQANCVARLAPLVAAFAAGPTAASSSPSSYPCDDATEGNAAAGNTEYGTAGSGAAVADVDGGTADPLLRCVELATRVTQNTDAAVAWATAGAAVLEQLLLGSTAEAAVRHVIHDLRSPQGRLAPFVWGMGSEIAGHLARALELRTEPVPVAVAALGRNCHMPNALQTPLHVVLHMIAASLRDHVLLMQLAFPVVEGIPGEGASTHVLRPYRRRRTCGVCG
ncbi:hypothetical protein VOLCADRAFT_97046 [Volvox carteri f. nagariensis]|uniref:Uncharacterized protein n=1 Tax=Volvox carteri f. nagariensis TaxID=3068 RepID=D8UBS0_VOLCA|nr:uncharacterized protein VOLCADRAFT_97046 [Volvox carteri f. nagariensis]EFJ42871.1 hypothetical protein VOLCADRAFT_97046 [Volvox carteri f. nagariensis]|eukprot:XP_002956131.1 hypothetical protein VOLCADRAFT_97046 [Volvox carteri f. nagariensis]